MKERNWILLDTRENSMSRIKLSVWVGSGNAVVSYRPTEVCVLTHIHAHITRIK